MQAVPAQVQLEFMQVHHPQREQVKVYNASSLPSRLHVYPLSAHSVFKVTLSKHSTLAPGMCDVLKIECLPLEYKHYQEKLRMSSDHGVTLEVILEAYPIMCPGVSTNKMSFSNTSWSNGGSSCFFPKRIDFGSCIICDEIVKTVELRNVIPSLDFNFEIIILVPHPYFQIFPLKGTIAGGSGVVITISFIPLEMCTTSCKIQLVLDQYHYVPFVTTICGSATGISRAEKTHLPQIQPPMFQSQATKPVKKKKAKKTQIPTDLFNTSPGNTFTAGGLMEQTTEVNGIFFASHMLNTHAGVASVLMQQPGKRRMKEIKARRNAAGGVTAGRREGNGRAVMEGDGGSDSGVCGRQMKELVFGQLVKANMEYERSKELKWFVCTGRTPFSENERKEILREREAQNTGPTITGRVVTPAHSKPTVVPTFDTRKNSAWAIRAWAIKRFMSAVRSVIVQIRARKRLEAMHNFLKKFNYNKSLIPDLTTEWNGKVSSTLALSSNAAAESSTDDAIASLELKDSQVRYPFFPGFRNELSFFSEGDHGLDPLPAPHIKEIVQVFDELGTFELKTGNSINLDYHAYSLSSSCVGSYIPHNNNMSSPLHPTATTTLNYIPTPNFSAGAFHTGAHEEDLSSMSTIQSLIVSQLPPEKIQVQMGNNEPLQDNLLPEDIQLDNADQLDPDSSIFLPLTTSYLPPLPQEFLKAPRAGPPNSMFTLDILRTAIVYASPPQTTETDISYPLCPCPREIIQTEDQMAVPNTVTANRKSSNSSGGGSGCGDSSTAFLFKSEHLYSTAHRSTPDTLDGAHIPDLVTSQTFNTPIDDNSAPSPPIDLTAIKMKYFIPSVSSTEENREGKAIVSDLPFSESVKPTCDLMEKLCALNLLMVNQNNTIDW